MAKTYDDGFREGLMAAAGIVDADARLFDAEAIDKARHLGDETPENSDAWSSVDQSRGRASSLRCLVFEILKVNPPKAE